MALNVKKNKTKSSGGNKPKDLVPAANHPARVVRILDMGLHPKINYKTKKVEGSQYRVRITYELLNSFLKDEDGNDMKDKPRWISEELPIPVALSYDDAPSQPWYGNCGIVDRVRAITGNPNAVVGDLSELLTLPCSVLVVHEPKKNDPSIIYANVGSVGTDPYAMMGQEAPALVNEPKILDLAEPDLELFNEQPNFVKEKILSNLEFNGSPLAKLLDGQEAQDVPDSDVSDDVDTGDDADTDDNPW